MISMMRMVMMIRVITCIQPPSPHCRRNASRLRPLNPWKHRMPRRPHACCSMIIKIKNYNLIDLPWHACAPVGKGDWSGIGPGECLARRLTVNLTTRNFVKGQNVKRNSDQDFQPQIGVLSKIIMMTNTCRLSLSERPIQRSAWSEPEKQERWKKTNKEP